MTVDPESMNYARSDTLRPVEDREVSFVDIDSFARDTDHLWDEVWTSHGESYQNEGVVSFPEKEGTTLTISRFMEGDATTTQIQFERSAFVADTHGLQVWDVIEVTDVALVPQDWSYRKERAIYIASGKDQPKSYMPEQRLGFMRKLASRTSNESLTRLFKEYDKLQNQPPRVLRASKFDNLKDIIHQADPADARIVTTGWDKPA